jgi:hypothetical protein
VLQIDEAYEPQPIETRTVYGVSLQQGRNDVQISPQDTFSSVIIPKDSPRLPNSALRDLTVATIALKYTQSNSVCYALNGQVIGLGAGQQSRIHCTRLAGDKADNWWMRFHERALDLKWKKGTKRPDKSNAIDLLCSGQVPKSGIEREAFEKNFEVVPAVFTAEEREAWGKKLGEVAVASDAFVSFPFFLLFPPLLPLPPPTTNTLPSDFMPARVAQCHACVTPDRAPSHIRGFCVWSSRLLTVVRSSPLSTMSSERRGREQSTLRRRRVARTMERSLRLRRSWGLRLWSRASGCSIIKRERRCGVTRGGDWTNAMGWHVLLDPPGRKGSPRCSGFRETFVLQ